MKFWGIFRFTLGEAVRQGTLIFFAAVSTIILLAVALVVGRTPEGITLLGNVLPQRPGMPFDAGVILIYGMYSQSVFWIVVFGIFGTAGLIPSMLEKGTAELFLSKPFDRAWLLMGRAAGASAGITVNILYVLIGAWLVFGLRLGLWHTPLLLSGLCLVFIFFVYFSIVAAVGLMSRSSGFTIMVSLAYIIISYSLESRVHGLYRLWDNEIFHRVVDGLYYVLPQIGGMLSSASNLVGGQAMRTMSSDFTFAPFLWSAGSAALIYFYAIRTFSRTDY